MGTLTRGAIVYCMVFLSVLALQAFPAMAQLPEPDVTFIPDQLSAESSFVMIADPGSVGGSVRINWVTDEGYGHFPHIGGRYMCYLSDTDYQSTCGPSPFRYPTTDGSPYLLDVFTFDSEGNQGNASLNVEIGGLKIIPDVTIDFDSGSVSMVAYTTPTIADSVSYRVFDSEFSPKTSGYLPMSRITGTPYYNGSVGLGSGTYYIAFKANSSDDFGGGMIKVDMSGGGGGQGGVLQADPVDIDVLVEAGSEPSLPQNKRIINTMNQTFEGVSISLPQDIGRHVTITIPNSTIGPYQTVYYTINLRDISSSLDINTIADIKSGEGTTLGGIPLRMRISYTSGGVTDCSQLTDGADCLGGCCYQRVCKMVECCTDNNCPSGQTCSTTTFRCSGGGTPDIPCTTGTCMTGIFNCPDGEEEVGTCISGGVSGICCAEVGECAGQADSTPCGGGSKVCCNDECVECCIDSDCGEDYECTGNYCFIKGTPESPEGEIDFLLIGLVAALAVVGGIGAWWFLKRRKKSPEQEFDEESKKEDDVFDEEEFY